jgi:hypothetical protein
VSFKKNERRRRRRRRRIDFKTMMLMYRIGTFANVYIVNNFQNGGTK